MDLDEPKFRIASWIGISLLAVAVAVVALRGDWTGVALLAAFLASCLAFLLLEDRLPALFDTLFVSAAMLNAGGWVWNLYTEVWGYDELAHFYTTFAVTLSFGYLAFEAMSDQFTKHYGRYVWVITSFGVTLGAWWEVVEWVAMKRLLDPVNDIVMDSLGALLAALLSVWVLRKRRRPAEARLSA